MAKEGPAKEDPAKEDPAKEGPAKEDPRVMKQDANRERAKTKDFRKESPVDTSEDEVDGCDVEMNVEDITRDEDLPVAEGGIA